MYVIITNCSLADDQSICNLISRYTLYKRYILKTAIYSRANEYEQWWENQLALTKWIFTQNFSSDKSALSTLSIHPKVMIYRFFVHPDTYTYASFIKKIELFDAV